MTRPSGFWRDIGYYWGEIMPYQAKEIFFWNGEFWNFLGLKLKESEVKQIGSRIEPPKEESK